MAYTTQTDTDNSQLSQLDPIDLTTSNATQTNMGSAIDIPPGCVMTVDAMISCFQLATGKAKVFAVRRHFVNIAGTVTAGTQYDLSGPDEIGGSLAASAELAVSGTAVQLKVTGVASGGDCIWRRDVQTVRVGTMPPASLSFNIWGRAPSSAFALPWSGVASAGDSGSQALEDTASTGVAGGTAVNGFYPAVFNGSAGNRRLYTRTSSANVDASAIFGSGAGTIIILAKPASAPADVTNTHALPGLFGVSGAGMFQMGYSTAGLRVSTYDNTSSSYKEAPAVSASSGAWHLFAARFTGSAVQASVDGSNFTSASTASSAYPMVNAVGFVGANYNADAFDGQILEVLLGDFAIDQSDLNWLKANYFNPRYNLSL